MKHIIYIILIKNMNAPPPERMIEKFVMYNFNKD